MSLMRAALGLFLIVAACSDPYEPAYGNSPCQDGMVLDGAACTAPNRVVTIDGKFDDWQGLTTFAAPTSGFGLQLARDGEAAILVRVQTPAAPETGSNVIYDLQLMGDSYTIHVGVSSGVDGWFYQESTKGDVQLGSTPAIVAFGADGFEMRVPIDLLPLPGEASVDLGVFHRKGGDNFQGQTPVMSGVGPIDCWDPHRRQNKCAHL